MAEATGMVAECNFDERRKVGVCPHWHSASYEHWYRIGGCEFGRHDGVSFADCAHESRLALVGVNNAVDYPGCFMAHRAVAQLGSALDWGSRGRRFKSCQPDQKSSEFPVTTRNPGDHAFARAEFVQWRCGIS